MAVTFPESTKSSVRQRLATHVRERWPQITELHMRHRGVFTYVEATTTGAGTLPLCRLRQRPEPLARRSLPGHGLSPGSASALWPGHHRWWPFPSAGGVIRNRDSGLLADVG